jgi:hypothetical protein
VITVGVGDGKDLVAPQPFCADLLAQRMIRIAHAHQHLDSICHRDLEKRVPVHSIPVPHTKKHISH